ncbi:MAG: DNA repair protein RecO [Pseudomonadota bacterium]
MDDIKSKAVILKLIDYSDNDLICHIFTEALGRVNVFARGAKKSRKRYPGLDLINEYEIIFKSKSDGKLSLLIDAKSLKTFEYIRKDIISFAVSSYLTELLYLASFEEDLKDASSVYYMFIKALKDLNNKVNPHAVMIKFVLEFLLFQGFIPNLLKCNDCNQNLTQTKESFFYTKEFSMLCCDCKEKLGHGFFDNQCFDDIDIKALVNILNLTAFEDNEMQIKKYGILVKNLVNCFLQKKMKSQEFLDSFL